jgi:hypothetical protein
LRSYLSVADKASFLPSGRDELDNLLKIYLLERAIHELGDALKEAPGSPGCPIIVLSSLLKEISDKRGAGASS